MVFVGFLNESTEWILMQLVVSKIFVKQMQPELSSINRHVQDEYDELFLP